METTPAAYTEDAFIARSEWLAEQALAVFTHYSGLRFQVTALNVTAMGVVFVVWEGGLTGLELRSLVVFLGLAAVLFALIVLKISAACAFHWGVYRRFRNVVLRSDPRLNDEIAGVEDSFRVMAYWRPSDDPNSNRRRYWLGFLWAPVARMSNFIFWPVLNLMTPLVFLAFLWMLQGA